MTLPTETHNFPSLPGIAFRGFRGAEDYPRMAALINHSKVVDGVERTTSPEEIARSYAHLKNCDPHRDMIFAEAGGEVIGYGRVWWEQEAAGTRLYPHVGFVRPEWRRRGIGAAMLRWQEARLRQVAGDHPKDGPRYFQAFAADTQVAQDAMLARVGYAPVRYFFDMARPDLEDIPDTSLPDGLEVRPAKPEHYRAIFDAQAEAFQDHWGFQPPTQSDYEAWVDNPDFQPEIWKVAWDGDLVAGMVLGYIRQEENAEYNRRRGYTENICVRRPWRKRGLASALISANLRELKAHGMAEAALGVDSENPTGALRVYERAGFRVVKRNAMYRKGMG